MSALLNLKKAGLLAVTATLLFASCKKDTDNNNGNGNNNNGNGTPPPAASAKLKKVTNGDESMELVYAADGKVQTLKISNDFLTNGELTSFAVQHNGANQISELKSADGSKITAQYANGSLATSQMIDENGQTILTTRYEYENGALKSATSAAGGIDALKFSFEYDAAGNVRKRSTWAFHPQTQQLVMTGYTTFEYDGKANPMHAQKNLLYLLFQNTSKNNSTKEVDFDDANVVEETREYTYQYNNQNLPQSATQKTTIPGQGSATETITYSYQ